METNLIKDPMADCYFGKFANSNNGIEKHFRPDLRVEIRRSAGPLAEMGMVAGAALETGSRILRNTQ